MFNKGDLKKQVSSLDMMIRVLSDELTHHPEKNANSDSQQKLMTEMEEALCELRQARGMRKVLLTALESQETFH